MKLKIELLSDFCTGSGEGFNSTVDTDAVFDEYGFPYIPAKRLRSLRMLMDFMWWKDYNRSLYYRSGCYGQIE